MTNFKRYIKNIFSIAGVEWRDGKDPVIDSDGLIVSSMKNSTASQRSTISDEQYIVSLKNMAENVLIPLIVPNLDILYEIEIDPLPNPYTLLDTDVGNLPAGTRSTELNGQTINYILDKMFFVDPPNIVLQHSDGVTKNLPVDDFIEVGAPLRIDIIAFHVRGFIQSGDGSPLAELTGDVISYDFTDFTGSMTNYPGPANAQNHIGDLASALIGPNTMLCDIVYGVGNGSYFWEDGTESFAFELQRIGGNAQVSETVIGQYKMFFGSGILGSAPVTPATIRALSNGLLNNVDQTEIELTLPAGDVEMYFYVPETYTVDEILHYKNANIFVGDDFVTQVVPMEDGGGNVINYTEFKLDIGGIGFTSNQIYKIKVTP